MSEFSDLFSKRLILVLGKGGVGRTTVAAALATSLARRGNRTLLYQANAKETLSGLLGCSAIDSTIRSVGENLWAVNTNASSALHEYGLMVLRYETVYRVVMENSVARSLLRAIPGLDDYALIGKMWFHSTERTANGRPTWDTIVFDAPATGHALNMLRIPRSILETVPDGPLTRDAVQVRALLEDRNKTAAVLVTLAEEMPTSEAIDAYHTLHNELSIAVSHLVVNQLYPDRFAAGSPAARVLDALSQPQPASAEGGAALDALRAPLASARMIRLRHEINQQHLQRLQKHVNIPQLHVPVLFTPTFGAPQIAEISETLEKQLSHPVAIESALL